MSRARKRSHGLTFFDLPGKIYAVLLNPKGAKTATGGFVSPRKGGDKMPITITFHIFGFTVTIRIKGRNRHSAQ